MPLYGLTEEQRRAATQQGNLLLTACPGAGKTRTLASKIAHNLNQKAEDKSKQWVIAITYTNVAAETILDRLDSYGIEKSNLWVGTIHSFCLEWILKPYKHIHPRVSKGYRIIDEYEQTKILRSIKKEFGLKEFFSLPTRLDSDLNVASIVSPEFNAARKYHEVLAKEKKIDFDLILSLAIHFLKYTPLIADRLSRLFEVIYIDEYQDTHQVQYDILSSIVRYSRTNLVLIGDVDQAIYTNLGAVVKNEENIEQEFNIDKLVKLNLSGCYRSTQCVIDFYRHFQDHNIDIESLTSAPQLPSFVTINTDIHRDQLAKEIMSIIRQHIAKGVFIEEIAILAPQWTDVMRLGRTLRDLCPDIPFDAPGVSPLPKNSESPFRSLIRLFFTNPTPDNYTKRRRLATYVQEQFESIGFSFCDHNDSIRAITKACNSIAFFPDYGITEFLKYLIRGFLNKLGLNIDGNSVALEDFNVLLESVDVRISEMKLLDKASYLKTYFNEKSGIVITTCHQTKGDEYEVVIATGLLKGKIPHWNDIINRSKEHQDYVARRLLYVISSRAKRYLYLFAEQGHTTQKGSLLEPCQQLMDVTNLQRS